jgi:hypothetical protein
MTLRALSLASALLCLPVLSAAGSTPNQLTPAETKAGWRLLFDGRTTSGWRAFKKTDFPTRPWVVRDGALTRVATAGAADHGGADIVTADTFSDFDLRFEWRISPAGNSGLKYFVTEDREGPIAHEYQVLDDARHPDGKIGPHRQTAAFYDVLPPAAGKPLRPVGEWNESRILVRGNHVEHWLNGSKVLAYELGSPEVKAAIARSKFKDVSGFGTKLTGRILLQDHGDEVAFRNLKILALPAAP